MRWKVTENLEPEAQYDLTHGRITGSDAEKRAGDLGQNEDLSTLPGGSSSSPARARDSAEAVAVVETAGCWMPFKD